MPFDAWIASVHHRSAELFLLGAASGAWHPAGVAGQGTESPGQPLCTWHFLGAGGQQSGGTPAACLGPALPCQQGEPSFATV